jgi:membrane protein implicated in regulation of membrane protease activity
VILIITLVLALVFMPWPWNLVVILLAAAFESSLAVFGIRWSRRRRAQVGIQTLVGVEARAITTLTPDGQVSIEGEIWTAHASAPARAGETVQITAVNGLTLEVEPVDRA